MMDKAESKADYGGPAKRWLDALRIAGKNQEQWEDKSTKIEERYKDDRKHAENGVKKYNILWSNIQTLKPAVYSRTPQPVVVRRNKDKDPVGINASRVLERALEYSVDAYDFDDVMKSVVEDRLLCGRGVARVIYDPTIEKSQGTDGEYFDEVTYEEVKCEYVHWKDFRHGAARKWVQVPWVAFRTYLTKDELIDRFGSDVANKIPLNYKPEGADDEDEQFKKAKIWEIWSKTDNEIIWVAEDHHEILDKVPPYLNLRGFFPCPKPVYATTTNSSLIPVPDFIEYQDQADELDDLTARINALLKALKVAGVYASDATEIKRLLEEGEENVLIPVENWQMFAERGGIDGMVSWLPIQQVGATLLSLYDARERTKQELYEITGLSDIVRGASNARETATAQHIKGQFATLRLSDTQTDVANFAKSLIELKSEVISEHFSPQTLQIMSGLAVPQQVMELLRNDALRGFRVDIGTDSTINIDEQADKESRVEFLQASSSFLETALPAFQQVPELGPLLKEMLMFGIRGFKAGRELEDAFEQSMNAVSQSQQKPNANPEAEAKARKMQQDMQISQARTAQELKQKSEKHAVDMESGMMDLEKKHLELINAGLPL